MIELIQLTKPNINWRDYLNLAQTLRDKNAISNELSNVKVSHDSVYAYSRTLAKCFNQDFLKHLHFSFAIFASREFLFSLMQCQSIINITLTETYRIDYSIAIISGTLDRFKEFIISGSNHEVYDIRLLANSLENYFINTEPIYRIFAGLNRVDHMDTTHQ